MAQIGTFTRNDDGSFTGTIKTLTLNIKARFVPAAKDSDKAPDLRAQSNGIEIGAGWRKTAKETAATTTRSSWTTRASPPRSTPAWSRSTAATP